MEKKNLNWAPMGFPNSSIGSKGGWVAGNFTEKFQGAGRNEL